MSQVLCKPHASCRIDASHRRFTIWPERIARRKKMPARKRSVSCCRWQASAPWTIFRICSMKPLLNSWRMACRQSWMTGWTTANTTTRTRTRITAVTVLVEVDAAIHSTIHQTEIQNCIIHQLRISSKYVSYKDLKALMVELKAVYAAVDDRATLDALEIFREGQ